jgi:protocatechuate 3,4-dioxygenase beta subunit
VTGTQGEGIVMQHKTLTRRAVLGAGMALPLGAVAAPAMATAGACGLTPRQTTGPFYPVFDQVDKDVDLTKLTGHGGRARGEVIRVTGRVLDEACRPVEGALVDLWQANANGRYSHPADPNPAPLDPNFQGWGQAVTDAEGRYAFRTIKPAAYPLRFMGDGTADEEAGFRTPHLHFRVSKRGHAELSTQMYFAGEALNGKDGVLRRVPEAERPRVVIAARKGDGDDTPVFEFDLVVAKA